MTDHIIPVKCDKGGRMVETFYDKSSWWGNDLEPDEEMVCLDCIKDRTGFRKEFKRQIGMSIEEVEDVD